jgi:hypothetical protein
MARQKTPLPWHAAVKRRAVGLSMYAAQRGIGLHPSLLVERRDAARGSGLYARDGCSAGTVVLVVPSTTLVDTRRLTTFGPRLSYEAPRVDADGPVGALLGCAAPTWHELAWRLALERTARVSHWWAWLGMLPTGAEYADAADDFAARLRVTHTRRFPEFAVLRNAVDREVDTVWTALRAGGATCPPLAAFRWAVRVLLTRGMLLPSSATGASGDAAAVTIGIVPVLDTANHGEAPSAAVHMLLPHELPAWYAAPQSGSPFEAQAELAHESQRDLSADERRSDARAARLFEPARREAPFYLSLTALTDITPGAEFTVRYDNPHDAAVPDHMLHRWCRFHF